MAVYKVHLLALFVVLSTSSKNCLASPWVWACDEQTQTCSRVLRSQVKEERESLFMQNLAKIIYHDFSPQGDLGRPRPDGLQDDLL